MKTDKYKENRYLLKDTVRKHVDFSCTDQNQRIPAPPIQKPCSSDITRIDLPGGADALSHAGGLSVADAILRRESVRRYSAASLTLEELAALLWATQGVRKVMSAECALRTVPSAGARHAFETYLVIDRVESLAAGLYRYLPFDQQLAQLTLDPELPEKAAGACFGQNFVASAAVTFFWTVIPARMEWRYDLAAHKVLAIEVGHVGQNLYLACESMNAGTCAIAAYDQEACDQLLGVDGEDEFTIYISPVGKKRSRT